MKRLAFLVGLLLAPLVLRAADINLVLTRNPAGVVTDRPYVPPDEPFEWATIPAVSALNGASGSLDVSAYLTAPEGATIAALCSETLPHGGFSFSAGTLTWSATTTTSMTCQFVASLDGEEDIVSNLVSVTSAAAPVADETSPNAIYGFTAVGAEGAVIVSGDCPSDPYVGEAGSGLASIQVSKDNANPQAVTSCGPGLSLPFVLSDPDSRDPSHSLSSGRDATIELTAGSSGGMDVAPVWSAQTTGADGISARVFSLNVTQDYGKAFLFAASDQNLNSGSWIALAQQKLTNGTLQIQVLTRSNGGSIVSQLAVNIDGLRRMKLSNPSGNTWLAQISLDGGAWTDVGSFSIAIPENRYWGYGVSGGGASGVTSAVFRNIGLTTGTWSTSYATTSSGTFTAIPVDAEGNVGSSAVSVNAAPTEDEDEDEPPVDEAGIIHSFGFEQVPSGAISETSLANDVGLVKSRFNGLLTITSSGAREGSKAARFQVQTTSTGGPGCVGQGSNASVSNPTCTGSVRQEVIPNGVVTVGGVYDGQVAHGQRTYANGETIWVGMSIKPKRVTANAGALVFQIQQLGSGPSICDDSPQPIFALSITAAGWHIVHRRWNNFTPGVSPGGVCTTAGNANGYNSFAQPTNLGFQPALQLGQWADWVFRFVYHKTHPSGRVTAWLNGVQVYDANTAFGHEVFGDGSWRWMNYKFGVYHWDASKAGDFDVEIDAVRISTPNEGSYEAVAPRGTRPTSHFFQPAPPIWMLPPANDPWYRREEAA